MPLEIERVPLRVARFSALRASGRAGDGRRVGEGGRAGVCGQRRHPEAPRAGGRAEEAEERNRTTTRNPRVSTVFIHVLQCKGRRAFRTCRQAWERKHGNSGVLKKCGSNKLPIIFLSFLYDDCELRIRLEDVRKAAVWSIKARPAAFSSGFAEKRGF